MSIFYLFILFIIYSFIGWILEVINSKIVTKKFVNRGFLIGPYCPIYGVGGLLAILLLNSFKNNIVLLFILSILICSFVEYFASYIMEKIFKTRWWDYSGEKFNINGRICLSTMLLFGIGCTILVMFVNPFINDLLNILNNKTIIIISSILMILFISDLIISIIYILKYKLKNKASSKDSTEKVSSYVRSEIIKKLGGNNDKKNRK